MMSSLATHVLPRMSIEEYLSFEEGAEGKHEFRDGDVLDMSGGSFNHALIPVNFAADLHRQLSGSACRVLSGDMRVRPRKTARFYYPDLSVVCGSPEFDDPKSQLTLTNPVAVVEVLSPSTSERDRGEKFDAYRLITQLREYLLVSQSEPRIDGYFRQDDGTWLFNPASGSNATFRFHSIPAEIRLADIYAGVVFPPAQNQQQTPASQPPVE